MTIPQRLAVIRYSTKGEAFSEATDISSSVDLEIFDQTDDITLKDTLCNLICFNNPTLMNVMITTQQASVPVPVPYDDVIP